MVEVQFKMRARDVGNILDIMIENENKVLKQRDEAAKLQRPDGTWSKVDYHNFKWLKEHHEYLVALRMKIVAGIKE